MNVKKITVKQSIVHVGLWFLWSWGLFVWMSSAVLFKARVSSSVGYFEAVSSFQLQGFLLFFLAQISVFLFLVFSIFLIAYPVLIRYHNKITRPSVVFHFIALIFIYCLLLLHQYLYPYSRHPMSDIIPASYLNKFDLALMIYFLPVMALGVLLLHSLFYWLSQAKIKNIFFIFAMVFAAVCFFCVRFFAYEVSSQKVVHNQPNIILIGVDSFELERAFSAKYKNDFINDFVKKAVVFENTKTTLARTYVAWMSLLSAKYPINNGVRFNLHPRLPEQRDGILLHNFKKVGYQVYYASDERRFSNLDSFHGFDDVFGPPIGAIDFLLGAMVDMPFSNLLLGSPLGQYFFPYSYANRAVPHSYRQEDYLSLLDEKLNKINFDAAPVFFSAHLCLGHWPYFFKNAKVNGGGQYSVYEESMEAVSVMASDLFENLSERGLLDNAVVVLMSDHGEGFPKKYMSSLGKVPPSTYGHGTNLLDNDQNKILFAVQYFKSGVAQFESRKISYPASIIDILPTIAGILGQSIDERDIDGLNLYPLIVGERSDLPEKRARFLETEIHLKSIGGATSETAINVESVLDEAAKYYTVAADGRLELNVVHLNNLLRKKDRAVELGDVFLVWDEMYGYRIYDGNRIEIEDYKASNLKHRQLMELFCDHFRADIDNGFVQPNLCF